MKKQTLIALLLAATPLMSFAEMMETSGQRITGLSGKFSGLDEKPKVSEFNDSNKIDIKVDGKQIQLAWDLSQAESDEKKLKATNAIKTYSQELAQEVQDKLDEIAKNNGNDSDARSTEDKDVLTITSRGERRCRAGMVFTKEPTQVVIDDLDEGQLEALQNDPELIVK